MIQNPKGHDSYTPREVDTSSKLAAIAGIIIKHLGEKRFFDVASGPDDSMAYFQTSVMGMTEKNGAMTSNKSIHKLKKYLRGGGAVILVVLIDGTIDRTYILLPSDLEAFDRETQNMKPSTTFRPSPFSTPRGGLSEVMSKYLCTTKDEIKARMLEHMDTGPRKSLDELRKQVDKNQLPELDYRDQIKNWLSDDVADGKINSYDLKIFGKLNVEFRSARLIWDKTKNYGALIRRAHHSVTAYNKVRAFCFVVDSTFVFVPSLTYSGTCAFAPTGNSKQSFFFYFKDGAFRASPQQYDESCVGDVLVMRKEDRNDEGREKLRAFAEMCVARPAMDEGYEESIQVSPEKVAHEHMVKREGRKRQDARRVLAVNT